MKAPPVSERGQALAFVAVVLAVIMVPLLALGLEAPRWYLARQALQTAADSAATAAANLGWDAAAFVDSGQVQFDRAQAETVARAAFAESVAASELRLYAATLTGLTFDDGNATASVEAQAELPPLLPLAPTIHLHAFAAAQARAALPTP